MPQAHILGLRPEGSEEYTHFLYAVVESGNGAEESVYVQVKGNGRFVVTARNRPRGMVDVEFEASPRPVDVGYAHTLYLKNTALDGNGVAYNGRVIMPEQKAKICDIYHGQ